MQKFQAYRIFEEQGKGRGRIVDMTLDELDPGDVVIETAYSSVNFKDALAGTGAGKIVRRYPCVGGIDSSGTVVSSSDRRFKTGDQVICMGYDMGMSHNGGYAGMMRVPADWVVPLPPGLTLFDVSAIGTAGYTSALAVDLLEHNGMTPAKGKIVVSGATGGCGGIAIDMLSALGYQVTAITGKQGEHEYLRKLGATEILGREALSPRARPLDKELWAAGFDSVGGTQLAAMIATMQRHGVIASFGNAGGVELHTTVLPFILRGVRLLGVDSAYTPMAHRVRIWQRLATDLKPRHLHDMVQTIKLAEVDGIFEKMLEQQTKGRFIIAIAG